MRLVATFLFAAAISPCSAATEGLNRTDRATFEGRWVLTASPKLAPRCNLPWSGSSSDSDGNQFEFRFRRDTVKIRFSDGVDFDASGNVTRIEHNDGFVAFHALFPGGVRKKIAVQKRSKNLLQLQPSETPPPWGKPPYFDGGVLMRCG
jgi:hypothetical protein